MYEKLYRFRLGRRAAEILARPGFTRAAGRFMDSCVSRILIKPFIRLNRVSMQDAPDEKYKSFNAFFTRRLKPGTRPIDPDERALISPCDGLLTVYELAPGGVFSVKGTPYTAEALTGNAELAREYAGGWCLVFRLTPADYHRYAFPDDGRYIAHGRVPGVFHTVRPEALAGAPVYKTNARQYACLETKRFGRVLYIEVGATMVGRIVNKRFEGEFKRGEEKGMFEFGGSTIILLTQAGILEPDGEILAENRAGREARVRLGEAVGRRAI